MKKVRGGAYLLEATTPDQVFTPEDFSEEQSLIAKTTEEFVTEQVLPVMDEIEKQAFSHTLTFLRQAGDLGLLAADIPEAYGGIGLDKVSSALIVEKLAVGRSFALSFGAHVGIGTLPIVFFGNEQQKQKYLPDLATGNKIAAYALTEPGSGSDALGAKTTATLNDTGTHYILTGEKQWITNSAFADLFIVYAKVNGRDFSAFIVEKGFQGVSTGPEEKKMGIKGSSTRTLLLDQVRVPVENLLGEVGKGHLIAFNILNIGRFKLAVSTVGSAKRALELSAKYAKERKQFQTPIASFPLIQEKLAQMAIDVFAVESAIYRMAGMIDQGLTGVEQQEGTAIAQAIGDYAIECSIGKVLGSEVLDRVVDEGVQIHGGYGYMAEYEIENIYRDSRINRIFEGTNEINRLLIPATIMRKASKGELPFFAQAQNLQEELLTYMPSLPDESASRLTEEEKCIQNAKQLFLMLAGIAVEKYGKALTEEQEVVRDLADLTIAIFAMESVYLRTLKAIAKKGEEKASLKLLYTESYIYQQMNHVERITRHTLSALSEGDELRVQLAIVRKLTRLQPQNEIANKRAIAKRLLDAEKYLT